MLTTLKNKITKSKKSGKGKKKAAKSGGGGDKSVREIAGIAVIGFGILSLVGLFTPAPLLGRLVEWYRTSIGLATFVLPLILSLAGLCLIVWKKKALILTLNVTVATLWFTCLIHVLRFRNGFDTCMSPGSLQGGGGFVTGFPACVLNNFIGAAGAVIVLLAAGMIYLRLVSPVSYAAILENAGIVLDALMRRFGRVAGAGASVLGGRLVDMKQTLDENRRDRLEALKREKEKQREERARKLMNEIQTYAQPGVEGEDEQTDETDEEEVIEQFDDDEAVQAGAVRDSQPEPVQEVFYDEDDHIIKQTGLTVTEDDQSSESDGELSLETNSDADQEEAHSEPVALPPATEKAGTGEVDHDPRIVNEDIEVLATEGEPEQKIEWVLPNPDEWLDPADMNTKGKVDMSLRDRLDATLKSFSVPATITNVVLGASFTRFEVTLEPGVKVSRVVSLENDIALSLAADSKMIRIEAPIPGKSAIGIEVPNRVRGVVPMRKIFLSNEFQRNARGVLTFVLGEDIASNPNWANLVKMPHLLVAGSTNSGKSVCLNCLISSILARNYPEDVRFIMMDMKRVELTPYEGIPHLMTNVVTEPDIAANALKWVCEEMDRRYKMFAEVGVRNIDGYNKIQEDVEDKLYRIVVIIDELADLMMVSSASMNVEMYICRIAQLARATGIHVILATQRPDTKVITGTIKNNIPSRISFAVPTQIDSRTILDQKGAESLLGRGDMLYMSVESTRMVRLQGAFVSDKEIVRLVDFWKNQGEVEYPLRFKGPEANVISESEFVSEDEELYQRAVEIVVNSGQASISMIQRKLRIGYNRAARLVELMEDRNVVGPYDGSKPREVLLTQAGFEAREF